MKNEQNKLTVKTTGPFELRDIIQDVDIGESPIEVVETSFVTQMVGLKRLEIVEGKASQEWDATESTQNPSVGEALPTRDAEPTIKELNDKAERTHRGRPPVKK